MGAFKDLMDSMLGNATDDYNEALQRRIEAGRNTTGQTGYNNRTSRALKFAQDVARGYAADTLGSASFGQPVNARASQAATTTSSAVQNSDNYSALNAMDEAERRSKSLQVDEENKRRANEYNNTMAGLEQIVSGIQGGFQTGVSGTPAAEQSKAQWDKTKALAQKGWNNVKSGFTSN